MRGVRFKVIRASAFVLVLLLALCSSVFTVPAGDVSTESKQQATKAVTYGSQRMDVSIEQLLNLNADRSFDVASLLQTPSDRRQVTPEKPEMTWKDNETVARVSPQRRGGVGQ